MKIRAANAATKTIKTQEHAQPRADAAAGGRCQEQERRQENTQDRDPDRSRENDQVRADAEIAAACGISDRAGRPWARRRTYREQPALWPRSRSAAYACDRDDNQPKQRQQQVSSQVDRPAERHLLDLRQPVVGRVRCVDARRGRSSQPGP